MKIKKRRKGVESVPMSKSCSVHSNSQVMNSDSWNVLEEKEPLSLPAIAEGLEVQKGDVIEAPRVAEPFAG